MDLFLYSVIFIFGLIVGSFLNCVIYRLEKNKSFLRGRSFCPHCHQALSWYDLIPILSFMFLKGKCRYCGKKISWQYPLVELATGFLFVLLLNYELGIMNYGLLNTNLILYSLFLILIACFLIIIFIYDLKHYIIPDKVIYPLIITVFLFRILNFEFVSNATLRGVCFAFSDILISDFKFLANYLLSAIFALAFFLSIVLFSKGKGMGLGDVKLAFFIGLFLGYPDTLVALFFAFMIGAIIGIGLILLKKKTLKSEVPFGPFLITGVFIAFFWGEAIIKWYLGLLA